MARAHLGAIVAVVLAACAADPGPGHPPPTPNFKLVLHDAPADDVEQVWITFDEVSVKQDGGGWTVADATPHTVDLKALDASAPAALAITNLPQGSYAQIRLHVIESHVVVGGAPAPLDIPSGDASGIKLDAAFEIADCGQTVVTLDWDLAAHLTANGRGYRLRPTLDVSTTYDDTTCCASPPCVTRGTCYVTARAAAADREVAEAVRTGACVIVDDLPATEPESGKPARTARPTGPAFAAGDGDGDGIPDDLEQTLARRFFPNYNLHHELDFGGAFNADRSMFYGEGSFSPGAAGNLAFAARLWGGGTWTECPNGAHRCIEIRYTLAYNFDLGDPELFGVDGHRGDSEFYAVLLQRGPGSTWDTAKDDPGAWYRIRDFMSAHQCTGADSSRFRSSSPTGSPAQVWASEGKHGGYPSQQACNSGGFLGFDDCGDHREWIDRGAATAKLHNAGSPLAPLDPFIPFPGGCKMCTPGGSYDVWTTGTKFGGSSAYGDHMKGCLWWDSNSYGCETCPYGDDPNLTSGTCAQTGDACGEAPNGCFCDAACLVLGDCCPDACSACGNCPIVCGDGLCVGNEDACCTEDCPSACGDGRCSGGETCGSCPEDCTDCSVTPACGGECAATAGCGQAASGCWCDAACVGFKDCCADSCGACGACPPACGNGVCAPNVEDNCNCPADCPPVCGNGTCDCQENNASCPGDCPGGAGCGDGVCWPFVEDACTCAADCPPVCGNGTCDCGETTAGCPEDCSSGQHCGDGTCAPVVEDNCNCPGDCPPVCGNGVCDCHESAATCPSECSTGPRCGDGTCDPDETCLSCRLDCGACPTFCGDGSCAPVIEDCGNCPQDCPCWMPGTVCIDNQCHTFCGNGTCEPFVEDNCNCPADCPPVCGNGMCDCEESCGSCPEECGACAECGDGSCDFFENGCNCSIDCGPCSP